MNKLEKVIVWRFISVVITLFVLLAATGNMKAATWVTVLLHVVLTAAHLAFESVWDEWRTNDSG